MKHIVWLLLIAVCFGALVPGCSPKNEDLSEMALMDAQVRLVQDLQEMNDNTFMGHLENVKNPEQLFELYLRVILGRKVGPEFADRIEKIYWSGSLASNSAIGLKILYLCTPDDSDLKGVIFKKWNRQCLKDLKRAEELFEVTYVYIGTPYGSEVERIALQKLEKLEKAEGLTGGEI
jgi:hypothetical protein